jgi:hypothetical protein
VRLAAAAVREELFVLRYRAPGDAVRDVCSYLTELRFPYMPNAISTGYGPSPQLCHEIPDLGLISGAHLRNQAASMESGQHFRQIGTLIECHVRKASLDLVPP